MPKINRLEVEGGFYHVINRGAGKRHIFVNDELKGLFFTYLSKIAHDHSFKIHAYCIMGNHYHILLQLTDINLSKCIGLLNSLFAKEFNKRRNKDGPIFKNRFKSIRVETEAYLLTLCRYIHLNPVTARVVDDPEDYYWSSYSDYLLDKPSNDWIDTSLFPNKDKFLEFMGKGVDSRTAEIYSKLKLPPKL